MKEKDTKYHDKYKCLVCDTFNKVETINIKDGIILEARTICVKCGHYDYWSHGFYYSLSDKI